MNRRGILAIAPLLLALGACVPNQQMPVTGGYAPPPSYSPPVRQVCDTRFSVVNRSSMTVAQLYFSHASRNAWGADQLGQNVLPPGRAWNYRTNNAGLYDFRIVWANGRSRELRRVNICSAAQIVVTDYGLRAR